MVRIRGRRPGTTSTRAAIVAEARRQFGDVGYRRTSLRSIAQAVDIDPRMISHFFGSKQQLFSATVELPFDPEVAFAHIFAGGVEGIGERLAEFILTFLADPIGQRTITGVTRAAVSEPEAAAIVRDVLTERLLTPLAQRVSQDRAELRASLIGTQIVGLVMGRYIVGLEPIIQATQADLVQALAPVLEHYLTGSWASGAE